MLKRFPHITAFMKGFTVKLTSFILCLVLFCACNANEPDNEIIMPGNADATADPQEIITSGGTLRVPMPLVPDTTHPLYVREALMRDLYSMIFEPLVSFNEVMEPVSCLAESWKYNAENNTWVIKLRANVHWHGNLGEVSGSDAAFTINAILADAGSIYHADLSYYVSGAEGYDSTLIIYPKVNSYALIYALNIPVIPRAYYEGKLSVIHDMPIGSGCFAVESLTLAEKTQMTLTAFEGWWKKLPYISRVEATGYSNTASVLEAFERGELDAVSTAIKTTEIYEILEGVDEKNYLSHNYVFLGFNLNRSKMADIELRKAIAYAIDRTSIINNVYLTKASGAEQPLFNDTSLSSASVTRYDHNKILSSRLLKDAGYMDNDGDGFIDSASGPLTLSLAVLNEPANPIRLEAAEYIRKDLNKIGINVEIVAQSLEDLKKTVQNKSYDMILSGYYLSDTPNTSFIFKAGGSGNFFGYSSQNAVNALNDIDRASTLNELKKAVRSLQTAVADELPQIGLFFEMNTILFNSRLSVGTVSREGSVYSTINTWYFKAQ